MFIADDFFNEFFENNLSPDYFGWMMRAIQDHDCRTGVVVKGIEIYAALAAV